MKILIGADLVPTQSNFKEFSESNVQYLFGDEILKVIDEHDASIFNLEVPITDNDNYIKKNGPVLKCPTSVINGIRELNPTAFSLANNHIFDYGEVGLVDTINVLKNNSIDCFGAGENGKVAAKPYIIKSNNKTIAIYSCVEHEFSVADMDKAGAHAFDPLYSFDYVEEIKQQSDYIIVLYHGGKEHYRYPSPQLQKVCRKFVEKGADLVICQHSHCIGCYEDFNGSLIIYGQGNFLFDGVNSRKQETTYTGLLVSVDTEHRSFEFLPVERVNNTVRFAQKDRHKEIINDFDKRSQEIKDSEFVIKKYDEFADVMLSKYLRDFVWRFGNTFIGKCFNKLFKFSDYVLSEKDVLRLLNFVECESHRELLIHGLKRKSNK